MASYVEQNLLPHEAITHRAHLHWIRFLTWRGLLTLGIAPLIDRWTSEYVITNKRIVVKTGLVSRHTLEMNLDKIETINVEQSIIGRLLGFGSVTIIGTGGTNERVDRIAGPMEFRRQYQMVTA